VPAMRLELGRVHEATFLPTKLGGGTFYLTFYLMGLRVLS